ncbi:MAG: S41 family peptidase [Flammeovirgaceae bacterium]
MKLTKFFSFCLLCLSLSACELLFMEKSPSNDPVSNFESLWKTLDERYSFFDYKHIDWDSVYQVYRPQVDETISDDSLFNVCKALLRSLHDGHVYLVGYKDIAFYPDFYLNYPANYNRDLLERNYLRNNDVRYAGPLWHARLNDIGYIYYPSFTAPFSKDHLDAVLTRFQDTKGLIIDVRHNEGGDPQYAFRLLERIVTERTHVYNTAYKSGPKHQEFETPAAVFVEPKEKIRYQKPVIVLANRLTYSAANLFVAMCKNIPSITIIGDYSGGGGGVPAGAELPNGWTYGFSSSILSMPDGFIIEHGVAPDIQLDNDPIDEMNGIDTILERALTELQ